jgi:gamma-glutamylputrescine oxidase
MAGAPHVESYYAATLAATGAAPGAGPPDRPARNGPALQGEVTAEVCILGGGFTGISAALNLAERGFDVVLLEAERIGWGASGRNGGQICTGLGAGLARVRRWLGPDDAGKLFALAAEAKAIIRERSLRHRIDCELSWGYFHGAPKRRHLEALRAQQAELAEAYGDQDTRLAEGADAVSQYVASPAYLGGLYEGGAGHLHPLKYCLGLARAAEAAGVRIFEGARALELDPGPRPAVRTARGRVSAGALLLCGNAYLGGLAPALRATVLPLGSYIACTAPLGAARARALIPGNDAVSDQFHLLNYYRLSRDHRLLFGGRVGVSAPAPAELARSLRRKMLGIFPQLGDAAFDYVWGGEIALTRECTPHLGRLGDNVYFAQGYSGQGVALSGLAGKLLAEVVAGEAGRFDLFARLPHRRFPGGRLLAGPALRLALLWYRLRDLL